MEDISAVASLSDVTAQCRFFNAELKEEEEKKKNTTKKSPGDFVFQKFPHTVFE